MRITRSTLRRLIAEESARLLREAAEEESKATNEADGGDGSPKMLHVMYRGFRPVFIVTDVDANPLGEEAENVTQQIQPAKSNMSTPELAQAIIDFITDPSNSIMYVFDEEMHDPETDDNSTADEYIDHLDGLIAAEEEEAGERGAEMYGAAVDRGDYGDLDEGEEEEETEFDPETGYVDDPRSARHGKAMKHRGHAPDPYGEELYEGDYGDKTDPYERGEGTYGKRARREEIGLTRSSMIWDPTGKIGLVKNDAQAGDINSAAQVLGDPERTHPLRQTILGKPGFRPVAELSLDLSYGDTAMDTQVQATIETDDGQTFVGVGDDAVDAIRDAEAQWRDMSGGSLDEGFFDMFKKTDPDSDGEDPDVDPLGDSDTAKSSRHGDYQHALKMGGGPDEEGFAIDYDTGRPSPFAAKMFGQPAPASADIEGPEQDDPFADDPVLAAGRESDYEHAWKLGAKSDAEGFAADYDTGKKKKFPPARGGLSEARWAKLAGIVKG